jgi:hypothetical protein
MEKNLSYQEKLESEKYVLKINIKDIVQIPEWQKLRQSFIGKWKNQPEKNLEELKKFVGNISNLSNRRLRIVQNYLTGSAFRIGIISSPEISDFTNKIKEEVIGRKISGDWI